MVLCVYELKVEAMTGKWDSSVARLSKPSIATVLTVLFHIRNILAEVYLRDD